MSTDGLRNTAVTAVATAVATVEGRVLTPALTALDERVVVPRLGPSSGAHQAVVGIRALLQSVSGGLVGEATAPAEPTEPTAPAAPAGRHDDEPDAQAQPDAQAEPEPFEESEPGRPLSRDEREDVESLADTLLDRERDERFVGELADDEIRRVQAEVRAKQMLEDPDHT